MQNSFDWIIPARVLASRYPDSAAHLAELRDAGVRVIINLTDHRHDPATLESLGMTEIHLPVPDFTAPTVATFKAAARGIDDAHRRDQAVAVHCLGGLGRTGTVVAAWLVTQGFDADDAIATVRALRPGSIETAAQEQSVRDFANERGWQASPTGKDAGDM